MFRLGQPVIKILKVAGVEVGVVGRIEKTIRDQGAVVFGTDEHLLYDRHTGTEIDPALGFVHAGISSRLIAIDGEA